MCGRVCCIRKYLQLIGFTRSNQCIDECARVREANILIHQSMYNQQSILPDKKDVVQRRHINNCTEQSIYQGKVLRSTRNVLFPAVCIIT